MKHQILRVVVGSQAHGLAGPNSDFDYRGVFVLPTEEILKIGGKPEHTSWIEGNIDDTSWEIAHFLDLATHCNPTILETFLAPSADIEENIYGTELRALFPYVWNSTDVMNAFIGYGLNQRKKMLEDKDARPNKFAAAYLRTLYNAWELLSTGLFTIRIINCPIGPTIKRFKEGNFTHGEVVDLCRTWETNVRKAYEKNPDHHADIDKVNEFLLKVRKAFWKN